MKVINIMNFVRQCDPRLKNSEEILFECTRREMELVNEFGYDNTFLLQYDAVIDPRYQKLFKDNPNKRTELGLWLEIVEPLVTAVGLPWRGRPGWKWDWYVVPGFSMAYTPDERRLLIDECMNKFRGVFGFYPATVCSWLLDSVTAEYLCEKYGISFMGICRDQVNTDAYTLIGGYFNQGYYPSRRNIFTPAQTPEFQLSAPVFRLLGPDPIHNYDGLRYLFDPETNYCARPEDGLNGVCTMEAVWTSGKNPEIFNWFMDTFYKNESLGFAYSQIGQENSFGNRDFLPALRMQLETLALYPDVQVLTMRDTGELFKKTYSATPATCVTALDDWNRGKDVQTVCYDSKNYCANLLRVKNRLFIRSLYLFDECTEERYLTSPAQNWDATYENLPIIDTLKGDVRGLELDLDASAFEVCAEGEALTVKWNHGCVVFSPDRLVINAPKAVLYTASHPAEISNRYTSLCYEYRLSRYALDCDRSFEPCEGGFEIKGGAFTLTSIRRHPYVPVDRMECEHIVLRKARPDDLDAIWKNVWSDPRCAEFMLWNVTETREEAEKRLERTIEIQSKHNAYFVCLRETDEPIGFGGVYEEEYGEYCESGLCISSKHQGRGYGKELVNALKELVFEKLNGRSFVYECFSVNAPSRALALATGFKFKKSEPYTRQKDGREFITEVYTIEK